MRPIGTDVARSVVFVPVCVCVLGKRVSCAKTTEPIEMSFLGLTVVDPKNHVQESDATFCPATLETLLLVSASNRHKDVTSQKVRRIAELKWHFFRLVVPLCSGTVK